MKREPDFSKPSNDARSLTLPLWMVWPILVTFISATAYFINVLNTINNKLDKAGADRWTRSHQRQFASELERSNPAMKVPDSDAVVQRLSQP